MLTQQDRDRGLDIAMTAVAVPLAAAGPRPGRRWLPPPRLLTPGLAAHGACFVTLRRDGTLLGCIGTLTAYEPLGTDIARQAAAAAFDDPRMPAVVATDLPEMEVHVSVLTPSRPLPATGWADLLARVRPGADGITIEAGTHRATLLPSVWEALPDPLDFLAALWRKAWLVPGEWPPGIAVSRYGADGFGGFARDRQVLVARDEPPVS